MKPIIYIYVCIITGFELFGLVSSTCAHYLTAENGVKVVASMPCYSEANTDAQRGRGVFQRSIQALKDLNAVGYGVEGSGLELDLMYNPGGAFLPPAQVRGWGGPTGRLSPLPRPIPRPFKRRSNHAPHHA